MFEKLNYKTIYGKPFTLEALKYIFREHKPKALYSILELCEWGRLEIRKPKLRTRLLSYVHNDHYDEYKRMAAEDRYDCAITLSDLELYNTIIKSKKQN